jgi:hypothetical protein
MRIPVYKKTLTNFLCLILLFLIGSTLVFPLAISQDESKLLIEVYDSNDWNESAGSIVFEGKSYDITVSTENDSVILGVNITVFGTTYLTNLSSPFITIQMPPFEESDTCIITATKQGYQSDVLELEIVKGELTIKTDRATVKEHSDFFVDVTDQNNNPVVGALVYVNDDISPLPTDAYGKAQIQAPETQMLETATIQALKSGYLPGSTTIRVENVEATIMNLTESRFLQILPVLLAILVVIISVIYVLLRGRKDQHHFTENKNRTSPENPPSNHKEKKRQTKNESIQYLDSGKKPNTSNTSEPRVEEIRIPVQSKKKETTIITDEQINEQTEEEETKHPDDWFKGQEYMRYKIDELTGKIDQKTDGKWFEGEQDTRYKVDEALKKNLKKKKVDQDTNE